MSREFLQIMDEWKGFVGARDGGIKLSEAALVQTLDLLSNKAGWPGYKWECALKEAITTSDFPYLFSNVVDRQMLARYKTWLPDWQAYCKTSALPDFNVARRHKVWGANQLLPEVTEKGENLVAAVGEGRYSLQVKKRGRQFDISWEAMINDIMNAFGDIPQRFADAAIYSEAYLVTGLFAAAAGPNPLLFGAPIVDVDGANVTNQGVLALTIANLETTLGLMAAQRDAHGVPISVQGI